MSKSLVTIIGLIVSLGVVALGFFLVALPLFLQATSVDAQTSTVANTNAIYQAQVDSLTAEQENLDAINASVDSLRDQIPASGQYDDIFEVIGKAADAAGVQLTSITAGESVAFVVRTGATEDGVAAPAVEPAPTETPDATADTSGETATDSGTQVPAATAESRQQVDFVIQATTSDMAQATEFLDRLRSGPRLLQSMQATTTQSGAGEITIQVNALAYVDTEG